jgi:hypothetical protein
LLALGIILLGIFCLKLLAILIEIMPFTTKKVEGRQTKLQFGRLGLFLFKL